MDGPLNLSPLRGRRGGVIEQNFVAAQREMLGRRVAALRVTLTPVEIDYDAQWTTPTER